MRARRAIRLHIEALEQRVALTCSSYGEYNSFVVHTFAPGGYGEVIAQGAHRGRQFGETIALAARNPETALTPGYCP